MGSREFECSCKVFVKIAKHSGGEYDPAKVILFTYSVFSQLEFYLHKLSKPLLLVVT